MSRQVRRSLALALAGLLGGLGLVLALFGGDSLRRLTGRPGPDAPAPSASLRGLTDPGAVAGRPDPTIDFRDDKPGRASPAPGAGNMAARPQDPRAAAPGAPQAGPSPDARLPDAAEAPRFDIVRVEPNGDAVVAGRGAPDAGIEMLVDGRPVARAKADANGQFAIVPPALPAGASTLRLRMTGKDGRATESQQSVAVDVAPGRDRQPLVALTAPDAATVVLSQPGAPGATADAKAGGKADGRAGSKPSSQPGSQPSTEPGSRPADPAQAARPAGSGETREAAAPGSAPTRIVSVDVQGNGRLFVTATGTPGARIQLYLNDTLIAPGSIGPDGRATFTIGRGLKSGQYQVRIDEVDPATGKVASRAAVPLSVPEPAQLAARDPAEPAPSAAQDGARAPDARAGDARDGADRDRPAAASPPATGSSPLVADMAGPNRAGTVFVPEISTARITRGDNLWRISQRTYGRGERYTVIYDANQNQIRDPDLIYPGQIFVLPADKRG
ncbi:LysM peptidoglycan-binding domain-containing protein [Methylobacterium sp. B1]|uniref:LysM peptidoglycan-binding domain-containing protein n=1 Tax=Methylobacterium sp. B1 TaxID=91459 RepID=UPI0005BBA84C|nr:LysM peptidoglycan-binding domain-containing protein [Methylobacterium sp. B1]